jgi:hypothetical protein
VWQVHIRPFRIVKSRLFGTFRMIPDEPPLFIEDPVAVGSAETGFGGAS